MTGTRWEARDHSDVTILWGTLDDERDTRAQRDVIADSGT
jgi:hypothetical protein